MISASAANLSILSHPAAVLSEGAQVLHSRPPYKPNTETALLAMVIVRVHTHEPMSVLAGSAGGNARLHSNNAVPAALLSALSFSTDMVQEWFTVDRKVASEEKWNSRTYVASSSETAFSSLLSVPEILQTTEIWDEACSHVDKNVFLEELYATLSYHYTRTNFSVFTHNFTKLNVSNGYHSFQWICSILTDSCGRIARITASLRTRSSQYQTPWLRTVMKEG